MSQLGHSRPGLTNSKSSHVRFAPKATDNRLGTTRRDGPKPASRTAANKQFIRSLCRRPQSLRVLRYSVSAIGGHEDCAPSYFSANSSLSAAQFRTNQSPKRVLAREESLLSTAKPGAGNPVACSTTREAIAGTLCRWHQRVTNSSGLANRFGPPRSIRRARSS
jgi:hypothetical protein